LEGIAATEMAAVNMTASLTRENMTSEKRARGKEREWGGRREEKLRKVKVMDVGWSGRNCRKKYLNESTRTCQVMCMAQSKMSLVGDLSNPLGKNAAVSLGSRFTAKENNGDLGFDYYFFK